MFHLRLIKQISAKVLNKTHNVGSFVNYTRNGQCFMSTKLSNLGFSNITSNSHDDNSHKKRPQTEQEFLTRIKNDPDTFGEPPPTETTDPGDLLEEKFHEKPPSSRRLRTPQYAKIIKSLIDKRKIKEALDVLEVRMLKEDKVKPEAYIYNLLLGACGRVGYTKKAFMLYNQMKKRGLKVMGATYTALFNACANSPWSDDGLSRAAHLRNIMIEKMHEPNDTTYNAMIKAFGRCGDMTTAFALVDEKRSKGFNIKDDTLNFLLQACINDKDAGFRHSLLVWRKFISKRISPSIFSYNLMLRSIRDCGIGDVTVMDEALKQILGHSPNKAQELAAPKLVLLNSDQKLLIQSTAMDVAIVPQTTDLRPNLMAKVPHLGNIISLSEVTKPEERLLLVGGLSGFLKDMEDSACVPDVKTFTQLLACLPGNLASENQLLSKMKQLKVTPDVDFYNMLIKKRNIRFEYEDAKDVLQLMKKMRLRPDLITYGVLALGCKSKEQALELIEEMRRHSYSLNTEILGTMLHQACHHKNFPYILAIMNISQKEGIKPNKTFMEHLKEFKNRCKNETKINNNKSFLASFRVFRLRYSTFVEEVQVDDSDNQHPWTQYRQTTDTNVRHYKDDSNRFKPRKRSRFRVKTSTKVRF